MRASLMTLALLIVGIACGTKSSGSGSTDAAGSGSGSGTPAEVCVGPGFEPTQECLLDCPDVDRCGPLLRPFDERGCQLMRCLNCECDCPVGYACYDSSLYGNGCIGAYACVLQGGECLCQGATADCLGEFCVPEGDLP